MINDNADKIMKGSEIVFNYIDFLYYKYHKTNLNCVGSYMDSPDQIKIKKATTSPINKKGVKSFQYAVSVALNHEQIGKKLKE